jgi:hypothetical protein
MNRAVSADWPRHRGRDYEQGSLNVFVLTFSLCQYFFRGKEAMSTLPNDYYGAGGSNGAAGNPGTHSHYNGYAGCNGGLTDDDA